MLKKRESKIKAFALLAMLGAAGFFYSARNGEQDASRQQDIRGEVKGVAVEKIDSVDAVSNPPSLLPVETYYGKVSQRSTEEILSSQSIIVVPEDVVKVFPDPALGLGSRIKIFRSTPITIVDADESSQYYTWVKNIQDIIKEKDILIGKDDVVDPGMEIALFPGMEIKITRVKFTEIMETEKIPFKTIVKEDPEILKGNSKIESEGEAGRREKYYEVRRENGKAVSRRISREVIAREAVDRVVVKGTKEPPKEKYGEGIATWYDWISGTTAAHNSLPYGTMVRVTNTKNGKNVVVKIIDHGIKGRALIDLSADAFREIGDLGQGIAPVRLEQP